MTGPLWKAIPCTDCDFSSGQRGMDRCVACGGSGSQLLVLRNPPAFYANTETGWGRMLAAYPDIAEAAARAALAEGGGE